MPDGVPPLKVLWVILCCDLAGSVFGFNRGTQSSSPHMWRTQSSFPHLHIFL